MSPMGPGKYDAECTKVREAVRAKAVLLIVFEGNNGTGFSMQTIAPEMLAKVPGVLRIVADEIEQSGGRA
jgi:hypothetical protein